MHYVRFLSPPTLTGPPGKKCSVRTVITINSDLGDSFLNPGAPIKLKIGAYDSAAESDGKRVQPSDIKTSRILEWKSGDRALKVELPLTTQVLGYSSLRVFVFPTAKEWAGSTTDVVASLSHGDRGRIMPVWADIPLQNGTSQGPRVSFRRLRIGSENSPSFVHVEEEIGETIARHIWDAGLVTTALLLDQGEPQRAYYEMPKTHELLASGRMSRVLELGCGVGILGLGLASLLSRAEVGYENTAATVLLTDLPEAEERARSNMARLRLSFGQGTYVTEPDIDFESLDWEEGRQGMFGPRVGSLTWDLIIISDCTYNIDMLPALVDTLSALHAVGPLSSESAKAAPRTKVLLATKPRHDSEKALFPLMSEAGWAIAEQAVVPLPVLGGHTESIELYLFEK